MLFCFEPDNLHILNTMPESTDSEQPTKPVLPPVGKYVQLPPGQAPKQPKLKPVVTKPLEQCDFSQW